MSSQVWKYDTPEQYLDPHYRGGEAMSEKVGWEEANEIRDRLMAEDPDNFYFIKHFTSIAVIDSPYPFDRSIYDSD